MFAQLMRGKPCVFFWAGGELIRGRFCSVVSQLKKRGDGFSKDIWEYSNKKVRDFLGDMLRHLGVQLG